MAPLTMGMALDLLGTFVFALSGAMLAVRRDLDLFGVLVLSVAAGLAGGLLRDIVLDAVPPAAFDGSYYLTAALAAGFAAFFGHKIIERLNRPVLLLDALGLGLFTITGCRKALMFGMDPLAAILLGLISAIGGGVLRDLLVAEVPRVLCGEVYALAAVVGAGLFILGTTFDLPETIVMVTAILVTFVIRVLSAWRGWQAPHAPRLF